jgi:hypothetical protein
MNNIGRSLEASTATFNVPRPGNYRFDIGWLFAPPIQPYQTLNLTLGGVLIGEARVDRLCTVEFFASEAGELVLQLPDACRPIDVGMGPDTRTLSVGIADFQPVARFEPFKGIRLGALPSDALLSAIGIDRAELAMRVESLGDNCEVGMVQRELGAEPLGLFRFASTTPESVVAALENHLEGIGRQGSLTLSLLGEQQEYMVTDNQYGLLYHTWLFARDIDSHQVLEREYGRMAFLARKFLDETTRGEKVFVYRDHGNMQSIMEKRMHAALQKLGPNHLLIVRTANAGNPPGTFHARPNGPSHAWVEYKGPDWWMISETWIETLVSAVRLQAQTLQMKIS